MLLGVQIHVIHQNTFARLSLVFLWVNGEKGERGRLDNVYAIAFVLQDDIVF